MTTVSDHRKTRTAAGPASRAAPPGLTGPPPGEAQPSLSHRSRRGHRRRGDVGNVDVGPSHRRRDAGETSAQPRVRAGPSHRHARRAAGDRGPWVSLPLRAPPPEPTLSIFPDQVHIGDRFTDAETGDEPHEWEVASRPVTFKKGHEVRARVQRPSDPGTAREKYWAAHEKITVRRSTAPTNRSKAEPDAADDVEALRSELRRLR